MAEQLRRQRQLEAEEKAAVSKRLLAGWPLRVRLCLPLHRFALLRCWRVVLASPPPWRGPPLLLPPAAEAGGGGQAAGEGGAGGGDHAVRLAAACAARAAVLSAVVPAELADSLLRTPLPAASAALLLVWLPTLPFLTPHCPPAHRTFAGPRRPWRRSWKSTPRGASPWAWTGASGATGGAWRATAPACGWRTAR